MDTRSFKDIRREFPDNFLVLVDCDSRELPTGELEILGAPEAGVPQPQQEAGVPQPQLSASKLSSFASIDR